MDLMHSAVQLRMSLFHEGRTLMLVFAEMNKLLDIEALQQEVGGKLRLAPAAAAKRFFSQPALLGKERKLFSLPVVMDRAAWQAAIEIGSFQVRSTGDSLLFTAQTDWLGAQARFADFSLSIALIQQEQPAGDDETVVSHAVARFTERRIRQRLADTLMLPALEPTVLQVISLRSNDDAGVDELVPLVKLDPSLSAQVMAWAQSSFFAEKAVRSIDDAIIRILGFDKVVNLALATGMSNVLPLPEDLPADHPDYWVQAVYMATLCEQIARQVRIDDPPRPGLAYLVGLLSNFGYLVLAHLFPEHFSRLSRFIEANADQPLAYIEMHVLQVTREQVGAWLLETWKVPAEVVNGVRLLNDPCHPQAGCYAAIAHVAYVTLQREGFAGGPPQVLDSRVLSLLDLQKEQVDIQLEHLKEKNDALEALVCMLSPSATFSPRGGTG